MIVEDVGRALSEPLGKLASLRPDLLQYIPRRTPYPRHCSGLQRRLEVGTEFIYSRQDSDGAVAPMCIVRPRALAGGILFGYAGASMRNGVWRRGLILPRVMSISYVIFRIDMYLQVMQQCTPNITDSINELFFLLTSRLKGI